MRLFLVNLLLTLIWLALTTNFKIENILFGFFLSFIIIAATSRIWSSEGKSYTHKMWILVKFLFYILWEMVVSSLRVAADVLKPKLTAKPGVIAVPLSVETDLEITLVANIISFTPGTLSLDVSSDKKTLFVHTMYANDIKEQRELMKENIEKKIKEIFE